MKTQIILLLAAASVFACGRSHEPSASGDTPTAIKRADGAALVAFKGKPVDLTKSQLGVSLLKTESGLADANKGNGRGASVMTCLSPLDPALQVGEAKCEDGSVLPILIQDLVQVCEYDGRREAATAELGCKNALVYTYPFEPQLAFFTESK